MTANEYNTDRPPSTCTLFSEFPPRQRLSALLPDASTKTQGDRMERGLAGSGVAAAVLAGIRLASCLLGCVRHLVNRGAPLRSRVYLHVSTRSSLYVCSLLTVDIYDSPKAKFGHGDATWETTIVRNSKFGLRRTKPTVEILPRHI